MSRVLFFKGRPGACATRSYIAPDYSFELWQPTWWRLSPAGLPSLPFTVWSLMSLLGFLPERRYSVAVIRQGSEIVHRATVTPRYFRFPFMERSDLQIGDTWTAGPHRGRGLAGIAIQEILRRDTDPARAYWYVVEAGNAASIRVIEKAGFKRVGEGLRTRRFGLRILGEFRICGWSLT